MALIAGGAQRGELQNAEATLRGVRWVGAALTVVQFSIYEPPPGVDVPFPLLPVGLGLAAFIVVVNLVAGTLAARANEPQLARLGIVELVVDAAIVLGVVWLFTFDETSALWALLVMPVLEGALRAQLRGAVLTWAAVAAGYVARDVWGAATFGHTLRLDPITYRLGIVLLVALTAGGLARSLAQQLAANREARRESEHRATMLRAVAAASRSMTSLDVDELLQVVVQSTVTVGFEAAELSLFDERAGTWRMRHQRNLPHADAEPHPAESGIAGLVRRRRGTVVLDGRSEASWPVGRPDLRALGFDAVVACPVWSGDELAAALMGAVRGRTSFSPSEIECLELLAAQAGVAFTKARRFAEQRAYEEQLTHQALHDLLTGLPNRALFRDRLTLALARARRRRSLVGVLLLDVDRFEVVNESLGHAAGDQLLVAVAERLQDALRPGDTVARLGGDEFTILCEDLSSEHVATAIAQRVADTMAAPFTVDTNDVYLTVSTGIAVARGERAEPEAILRDAEAAMSHAKELGKARYELFDELLHTRAVGRLELYNGLRRAIERGEFRLHYQPEIELSTGRMVGVEALVRWQHPQRGLVAPDEFIGLAEDTGLIIRIGAWALREACRETQAWQLAHPAHPPIRVSVNLSARQLADPDLVATAIEALQVSGLPPAQLRLEMTESAVMDGAEHNVGTLRALKALGVEVAIDDFGTGYSSLSYLKRFPVDALKIDRSFVGGLGRDPEDTAIVSAVVSLGRALGLDTVAEGVETNDQRVALRELGCRLGQGFVWSKAIPMTRLDAWLREGAGASIPA